jgi:hypothetical protein
MNQCSANILIQREITGVSATRRDPETDWHSISLAAAIRATSVTLHPRKRAVMMEEKMFIAGRVFLACPSPT